jgi:hypothetical protein
MRKLIFFGSQDFREPVEAGFPPGSGHHAGQRRGKSGVPNCDPRSAVDLLQMKGHFHRPDTFTDRNPSVYELSRRSDCRKFAFEDIGVSPGDARCSPSPTHSDVPAPFSGVKYSWPDPPLSDLIGRQRSEYALGGGGKFRTPKKLAFNYVGDRASSAIPLIAH